MSSPGLLPLDPPDPVKLKPLDWFPSAEQPMVSKTTRKKHHPVKPFCSSEFIITILSS
jgi:hypothetical protein